MSIAWRGLKSGRKRVDDRDSTPRKPFSQIFRQKQATPRLRRRSVCDIFGGSLRVGLIGASVS
jgi:hypothetical protein